MLNLPDSFDDADETLSFPENEWPQHIAERKRAARTIFILQAILYRREMVAGSQNQLVLE